MKKFSTFFLGLSVIVCGPLFAAEELANKALSYVPQGEVISKETDEIKIRSLKGGVIEIEFKQNGSLDEASGDDALGDQFVPGEGLLSLKEAVSYLVKNNKKPTGEWTLEKSFLKGWHYEIEGNENGQAVDYILDAKTGKILDTQKDD